MNIRQSWLRTIVAATLLVAPLGTGWAQLSFVEAPTLTANPTGRVPLAAADRVQSRSGGGVPAVRQRRRQ